MEKIKMEKKRSSDNVAVKEPKIYEKEEDSKLKYLKSTF